MTKYAIIQLEKAIESVDEMNPKNVINVFNEEGCVFRKTARQTKVELKSAIKLLENVGE